MTTQNAEIMDEKQLSIDGELTISTVAETKTTLSTALDHPGNLVVDLGNVEELDTAGLQLMLAASRYGGDRIRFVNHSAAVLQILALSNMGAQLGYSAPDPMTGAGG